jgi:hypothetical protein
VLSIITRLGIIIIAAAAFVFGLVGAVYVSLRGGGEVKVPNVVGKSRFDAETELERAGLKMRKRAERYQEGEKPDIVLDQSPREGELIKNGQTVAVVVSSAQPPGGSYAQNTEAPSSTNSTADNTNKNVKSKNDNKNAKRRQQDEQADENLIGNTGVGNANAKSTANSSANANRSGANLNGNASNANAASMNRNAANANNANANRNANARPKATNDNANAANRSVNPRVPIIITPMSPNGKP